jgi:hypothetical protein
MQKPVKQLPSASASRPGGHEGGKESHVAVQVPGVTAWHCVSMQFTSGLHVATTHPGVASHSYSPPGSLMEGQIRPVPAHAHTGVWPHTGAFVQTSPLGAQWWNA